jgi:hypothetical protein
MAGYTLFRVACQLFIFARPKNRPNGLSHLAWGGQTVKSQVAWILDQSDDIAEDVSNCRTEHGQDNDYDYGHKNKN